MCDVGCDDGSANRDGGRGPSECWYEGVGSRVPGVIWLKGSRWRLGWIRGKGAYGGEGCGVVLEMQQNRVRKMWEATVESGPVGHPMH